MSVRGLRTGMYVCKRTGSMSVVSEWVSVCVQKDGGGVLSSTGRNERITAVPFSPPPPLPILLFLFPVPSY